MNEFLDMGLGSVVIVCDHARQTHPFFPGGKEIIHKGFEDPAAFRGGKDNPKGRVQRAILYLTGVA